MKEVYIQWSDYTKRREDRRDNNKLAAKFYLNKIYEKVYINGFKHIYEQKCKLMMFKEKNSLVSKCWEIWRSKFSAIRLNNKLDAIRQRKDKNKCFHALLKYSKDQKYYRDIHNTIVLNSFKRLKQKAFNSFLINLKNRRHKKLSKDLADKKLGMTLSKKAIISWKEAVNQQKRIRKLLSKN